MRARHLVLCVLLCAVGCVEVIDPASLDRASSDTMWVKLPQGATSLIDIGIYRIGYRRYGREPVDMPMSWRGFFTPDAGLAFQQIRQDGKPGLLLHCPWLGGTGAAFVEYFLDLPKVTPIRLEYAICMRPDVVGKSDGVTFSASVSCDGATKELMKKHFAVGEPESYAFDLSKYAGRRIVLRIQTEPGPAKSAGFDFSRFLDPRIVVGKAIDRSDDCVARMTGTKAYALLSKASLLNVANRSGQGIAPSCKLPHSNSVEQSGANYVLSYKGEDGRIVYQYSPRDGSLNDVIARVDQSKPFRPCCGGGIFFEVDSAIVPPKTAELVSHKREGKCVVAVWKYATGDQTATVEWRLRIRGKALVVQAASDDLTISKFSLGCVGAVDFRTEIPIPYLGYQSAYYLPAQNAFALGYIDWTKSHASHSPGMESTYIKKLDGKRNALRESGYVSLSSDIDEVLPNIPHAPSPYMGLLGPRMMVDIWGGMYEEDAKMLEEYKRYGLSEIAIIKHSWQCYGYDVKLPDHLPANAHLGGDEKMKILAATAKRLGYVFSLHENYIDFYPDAPSWNPKDVVLTPKGEFSKAWYHKGTKVQSFAMKTNRMLHYAAQNSPEIHRRFGTTASYLDVHTCVPPWHHVDYQADQELAGTYAAKVKYHRKLFQFERDTHKGPLFGEGNNQFFWAGQVDGVEAQVRGGEDHDVFVDFDLLKLHPQMVNHGMGYYTRWLRTRRETKWGVAAPTPLQMDKYRAQELAYGHAAFVGSQIWRNLPLVIREYYLCQPVQALYGDAKATEIRYEVDGRFVSSSVAVVAGVLDRLRVKYDSGLTLHVNLGDDDWAVGAVVLPPFGFLAAGPDTVVYTAKRDGILVDYAETAKGLYVDSRTQIVAPWTMGQKKVEPRLKSLKYLGGRKFQITYEWVINDTFDKDLHCFVHFCAEDADRDDKIVFQNDHKLPTPTSQWKPGMVLTDGPYTIEIPAGAGAKEFDILVGLHKGGRVKLVGVEAGSARINIGRLVVKRKNGAVAGVAAEGVSDLAEQQTQSRRQFTDRMNTAGKAVDFGPATTNGSFALRKRRDRLELLPFPRDKKFRIELDLQQILGTKEIPKVHIEAEDAKGNRVARVSSEIRDAKLVFLAGVPGAAKYVIRYR